MEPAIRRPTGFIWVRQRDVENWKNNTKPDFPKNPSGFILLSEIIEDCYVIDHPMPSMDGMFSILKISLDSELLNSIFVGAQIYWEVTKNVFNMLKILANSSLFHYSSAHDYNKEKTGCKAEDTQPAVIIKQVKEMRIMKTAPSGA